MRKIILGLLFTLLLLEADKSGNRLEYEKMGTYVPQVYISKNKKGNTNYVSYYPKNGIHPNMPVIFFIKGGGASSIHGYSGIMKFLASKGYYVLGVDTNSYESWYVMKYLDIALADTIKKHKLNISKLAVMGHSLGGGQSFYVMETLHKKGYGNKGSLVVSIDGWFSFGMNKADFSSLRTKASFIQMNGVSGTGIDPRIYLKIWNLLTHSDKSFYTLKPHSHNYIGGDLNNILDKKDLLSMIGALTDDTFNNRTQGKKSIAKNNKASYSDIFNALQPEKNYRGDCKGIMYNAIKIIKENDIDYCSLLNVLDKSNH